MASPPSPIGSLGEGDRTGFLITIFLSWKKIGRGKGLTIAGVVAVTVHERDFDAVVEEVCEILDLAAADIRTGVVTYAIEGFIDAIRGFGVVDGHT